MEKRLRKNEQLEKLGQVMLVDDEGKPEVMECSQARALAQERGLDLVEIGPGQTPPVCKIMNHGAHAYREAKRQSAAQKTGRDQELKEMRFRAATGEGDFDTKVRQLHGFLAKGHKVKVSIRFRGREIAHSGQGFEMIQKVALAVEEVGQLEAAARMEGRQIVTMFSPGKGKKKAALPV
jgi:translation initiation factor IF-3